jgi:hypothetical protein
MVVVEGVGAALQHDGAGVVALDHGGNCGFEHARPLLIGDAGAKGNVKAIVCFEIGRRVSRDLTQMAVVSTSPSSARNVNCFIALSQFS